MARSRTEAAEAVEQARSLLAVADGAGRAAGASLGTEERLRCWDADRAVQSSLDYFLIRDDPELIPSAIRAVAVDLPCSSLTVRRRLLDLTLTATRVEGAEVAFTPQE